MQEWYHCTANQPFSILLYWLLIKGNPTKKWKVEEKRKNQIDGRKQKQKREKRRERQQRKKQRITPERKQKEETILLPRESNKVKKPLLKYAAAPILPLNDRKNGSGSSRLSLLLEEGGGGRLPVCSVGWHSWLRRDFGAGGIYPRRWLSWRQWQLTQEDNHTRSQE